ncbi:MAG: hypothetical protein ABI556_17260, partial [Gemmatimonadales bacterium]
SDTSFAVYSDPLPCGRGVVCRLYDDRRAMTRGSDTPAVQGRGNLRRANGAERGGTESDIARSVNHPS